MSAAINAVDCRVSTLNPKPAAVPKLRRFVVCVSWTQIKPQSMSDI
jgi:hypothetical protein